MTHSPNVALATHPRADKAAIWKPHPFTGKIHLFVGIGARRALCGTIRFRNVYRLNAPSAYCTRCIRAAGELSLSTHGLEPP